MATVLGGIPLGARRCYRRPDAMAANTRHVLVLFGGASGEHSISIRSAATVVPALERAGHRVTCIGLTRAGQWRLADFSALLRSAVGELVEVDDSVGQAAVLVRLTGRRASIALSDDARPAPGLPPVDVVFPVLHGPHGEDGTMQGLLDVLDVPFVGAGCAASAMAMDKLCMKTLCTGLGIPQTEFLAVGRDDAKALAERIRGAFGFPCFVKPANLGSSVGISRVATADALDAALAEARRWDARVLVERAVDAREIEIALLGGDVPALTPLGEIVAAGFYDFDTKYVGDDARLIVPAELDAIAAERIRSIALQVWDIIGCRGMARADFFVERGSGRVLFNEVNTIPGFTRISMYPRLWQAAGLEIERLVDILVRLASGENVALPARVGQ
jgi:D-alanine-D-alanine ligase